MGDDFFAGRFFPFVDIGSGGSVEGLAKNIGDSSKLPAGVKLILVTARSPR